MWRARRHCPASPGASRQRERAAAAQPLPGRDRLRAGQQIGLPSSMRRSRSRCRSSEHGRYADATRRRRTVYRAATAPPVRQLLYAGPARPAACARPDAGYPSRRPWRPPAASTAADAQIIARPAQRPVRLAGARRHPVRASALQASAGATTASTSSAAQGTAVQAAARRRGGLRRQTRCRASAIWC